MKLVKKTLIVVLATSLLASPSRAITFEKTETANVHAQALNLTNTLNYSKEINKAFNGIIDQRVSEEVLERVSAFTTSPDAEVSYTVTYLGSVSGTTSTKSSDSDRNVYSITAATKTTTATNDEYQSDGLYAWISLTWIDNLGLNNEIVRVQGGWGTANYVASNRQVWYGVKSALPGEVFDGDLYECRFPSTNSFNYTPSKSLVGGILRAYSWCDLKNHLSINVQVIPTIFD